jgi:hypothetical protein
VAESAEPSVGSAKSARGGRFQFRGSAPLVFVKWRYGSNSDGDSTEKARMVTEPIVRTLGEKVDYDHRNGALVLHSSREHGAVCDSVDRETKSTFQCLFEEAVYYREDNSQGHYIPESGGCSL